MNTTLSRLLAASAFAALIACVPEEGVDPAPHTVATPTGTTTTDPPPPKPTPKRTVIERSPFGNVAATQNLLWDGDFEWSSAFTDQYGWIEPPSSATVSDVVVGAACRSGMKCVRIAKNRDLVGIAVSSAGQSLDASVWIRFEDPAEETTAKCADAEATLFDLGGLATPDTDVALVPLDDAPDADGWCQLAITSPERRNKTYFYVENLSSFPMLVDDAVLLPSDAAIEFPLSPVPGGGAIGAARLASLARARDAVHATRRPIDGKPNAARDALAARRGIQ